MVRLLQRFQRVNGRDTRPRKEVLRLLPSNGANRLKVRAIPCEGQ
jgi:hypothetical protein